MVISLRVAALALVLMVACSGEKFGIDEAGSGGRGGAGAGTGGTEGGAASVDEGGAAGRGEGGAPDAGAGAGHAGAPSAGEGGYAGEPMCDAECDADEECAATPAGSECRCAGGLVADGEACRFPRSCDELHRYAPTLPSGTYALKPEGADRDFKAHCGMVQEGGGWTLVVNEGPTFDPATSGVTDALCYASSCTSIGYSLVLVESDVMLDVGNSPIVTTTYAARLVVTGIHSKSRGKTLRTLFTTGPHFVEAEDNSNLAVRMRDGAACDTLPVDLAKIACQDCNTAGCKTPVIVFGDGDAAPGCREGAVPRLAIGAATDYATAWNNCAGWPQDPDFSGTDFYPDYVRVWVR